MYYKDLAHAVMEAEKSHDLPSASWRPREAGGVIQPESKGLSSRGAIDRNPSLRAGDEQQPSSIRQKRNLPVSAFCSIQPLDWVLMPIHWGGQSAVLTPC